MKTTMFMEPGKVQIEDIDKPTVQAPDDVIIHVVRTCVCGSDLWAYRGLEDKEKHSENTGHEAIGIVEEVGSDITTVLDAPQNANQGLERLMAVKAPWA